MKLQALSILISLALLSASPVMSDDMPENPLSGLFPVQQPLPDDPGFDLNLFFAKTAETFADTDISDPDFLSFFEDKHIQQIPPEAFPGFTAEQFKQLPPNVFDSFTPAQFVNLLPEVLAVMDSERFKLLAPDVVGSMSIEQIGFLPREAIDGMTKVQFTEARNGDFLHSLLSGNIGGLSPEVIELFDTTDFAQLNKEECLQMPPIDLTKLFTNLDQNNFEPDDIIDCLPPGWTVDDDGALGPPANSRIFLDVISKPDNLPDNLKIPDIFNLNSGLAVGGRSGNGKALDGINNVIKKLGLDDQFVFKQAVDVGGILSLIGKIQGTEWAFIPDPGNSEFLAPDDPDVAAGLSIDPENGAFRFITEAGLRLPLLPMAKDLVKMMEALTTQGVQGVVTVRDDGVVIVPDLPEQLHPLAFMFDMMVTSDPGFGPGLHKNPLGDGQHWLVDTIGNAQRIHPTLPEPEDMENWGHLFDIKIKHQTDGSFKALLAGLEYILKPTFEVETRPLTEDEQITPGFGTDSNGKMAFITQKDGLLIIIRIIVMDPDGNIMDL